MQLLTEFTKNVIGFIKRIPHGKVATYGQIAELSGKPHAARGVAWILHSSSTIHRLPWHRVINSQGRISFSPRSHNYREQKRRLIAEGVVFKDKDKVQLSKYQWKKRPKKTLGGPKMFGD